MSMLSMRWGETWRVLAYMAAKGDKRITSATFFVALLDFSGPG